MKFDLQKALAGHPIVYRNGETPKEWHYFKHGKYYSIISVNKDGLFITHHSDGAYFLNDKGEHDLFLAPKEETLWVAVAKVKTKRGRYETFLARESIEQFKEENLYVPEDYTYHQITREVE